MIDGKEKGRISASLEGLEGFAGSVRHLCVRARAQMRKAWFPFQSFQPFQGVKRKVLVQWIIGVSRAEW